MRYHPFSLWIKILWVALPHIFLVNTAIGQTVTETLEQFDRENSVMAANQFFDALDKEAFTDKKVSFPPQTHTDSLCQQVWYWAAEWLYDQQQYEKAAHYGLKSLPLIHPSNETRADCLNLMGLVYLSMGKIQLAAEYAKQCLEIDQKSGDDDRISSSMNTVAGIYMAGYQTKEAEQYILGALRHAEKADNPARKAVIQGMASEIYHSLGDDNKALAYAEKAYRIDSLSGRMMQASIRLSQKGSALLGLHRYQEAEAIFRRVIPVFREGGDHHSLAIALNHLGMSLLCQERQREAIPCYKEAASLLSKMGDLYNEIHAHRGLYESYWKINPDSAKKELDLFDLLKDSLYTNATAEALSRYHAEFGTQQLQQENEEAHKAHHRSILMGIIGMLLIIMAAWWINHRNLRRQQKRINELVHEIEQLRSSSTQTYNEEKPAESTETARENDNSAQDEDKQLLIRVIDIVNEAMPTGHFSVEEIAGKLNMSVQTFRRRLQYAAGESPKAYISAIQMERAATLLTESREMPVSQVARLCGFDETSSFSHAFKRVYGCSPSQYREKP